MRLSGYRCPSCGLNRFQCVDKESCRKKRQEIFAELNKRRRTKKAASMNSVLRAADYITRREHE